MNPFAKNLPLHCTERLLVAGLCSLVLPKIDDGIGGNIADDGRKVLLVGVFGGAAIVFLLPILVRGDWGQRILAAILLVLPTLSLLGACAMALEYLAGLR